MRTFLFRAKSLDGIMIEACCVINKRKGLLLSNENKGGFWIRCQPDSLEVIEVDVRFKEWFQNDLGKVHISVGLEIWNAMDECDK